MSEVEEELVSAIMAASRAVVAIASLSIEASPVDVTLSQYRVLVLLVTRGPQRMSDLGQTMRLSPSSTTRLVERLERKSLVERRPSSIRLRETELHLTPAGTELVEVVMEARRREIEFVVQAVPPGRRKTMAQAFEDFALAAGEPIADPDGGGTVAGLEPGPVPGV